MAVTVSRHWDSPKIHTVVSGDGIAMAILLDDYVKALASELYAEGRWWLSKATFDERIQKAANRVLSKVKEESAKVV